MADGRVLRAFDGAAVVRSLRHIDGAVLLERIVPGNPLTDLVVASDDDAATDVLAALMAELEQDAPVGRMRLR
jgi:streptomycin 6-kinase